MGRSRPRGGRGARAGWAALVVHASRVPRLRSGRGRVGLAWAVGLVLVVSTALAAGMNSCAGGGRHDQSAHVRLAARIRVPASAVSVLAGAPDVVAAGVAQRLFASAPVVVVASPERPG